MSQVPTQSFHLLLVKRSLWAASCIKMANRAYTGPIRTKAAR